MKSVVGRRVFVGSVVAGLPLVAGAGVGALAQSGDSGRGGGGAPGGPHAQATHHPAATNAVDREILRQIREGVAGMGGPKSGEFARRMASTLRFASVHFAAQGLDASFDRVARAELARQGREVFLARDFDRTEMEAQMRAFGFTERPPKRPVDYAARERALQLILSEGVTAQIARLADLFDSISETLDRYPARTIAYRQSCPPEIYQALIELAAFLSCLLHPILCAIFGGAAIGLNIGLALYGC